MGTSSFIGIKLDDTVDSVKYVYCHWDGGLSHNGKILKKYFHSKKKALQLIDNRISSVIEGFEMVDGSFYYNPRELNNIYPDTTMEHFKNAKVNFVYLFDTKINKWLVYDKPKDQFLEF